MDLTIQQTSLHRALRLAGRAVPARAARPILQHVLLIAEPGLLTLAATDLELGVVTSAAAEVITSGRVAVPARLLGDFVAQLPPEPVRMSMDATKPRLQVRCGRFTAGFATADPDEFPALPSTDGSATVALDARQLHEALERVAFAAARDESRPVLAAVCLRCGPEGLTLTAADGFRLSRVHVPGAPLRVGSTGNTGNTGNTGRNGSDAEPGEGAPALQATHEVLVPARAAHEFVRVLADAEAGELLFAPNGSGLHLRVRESALYARLVEGKFPDVDRVIPQTATARVCVDTAALRQAVTVASLFGNNVAGRPVRLDVAPDRLRLLASGDETGDAESELSATLAGQAQEVVLSAPLLTDILAAVATTHIELALNGPLSPVALREVGREDRGDVWVQMPMHSPTVARPGQPRAASTQQPETAGTTGAATRGGPGHGTSAESTSAESTAEQEPPAAAPMPKAA